MRYILLIGILWWSCKAAPTHTLDDYQGERIIFGNSGGFAGTVNKYCLFENGQCFKFDKMNADGMAVDKWDKKLVGQVFSNYETLGLKDIDHDDRGNMTYFLIKESEGLSHSIHWGGMNKNLRSDVQVFYDNLWKLALDQESKTR